MSKNKHIFERREKKYRMSLPQFDALYQDLLRYMEQDDCGLHTICSLYYDTDDFQLIRHSMDKPVYREKFRIRSYGVPSQQDKVFMELKKKFNGVVYKRRAAMTLAETSAYLTSGDSPIANEQIMQEIDWFLARHKLSPKVMIAYDRVALFGKEDPDFRITFDFRVRWRNEDLDLSAGDYGACLLPEDECLMEVKALGSIPFWLSQILAKHQLYPASFSKYANCYKQHLYMEGKMNYVS
ncbi:VTC domain-containing protein [Carnobacterium gallinarum]|uniref:polyphosphate polymerase domain-containing protein n=1 Tax=Carnobacterium gallinarum TaxID=2749 RepID=UPI00055629F1|nr:polyphosphate polymerase domain-containing protein [Carnobacterium gallinarum]